MILEIGKEKHATSIEAINSTNIGFWLDSGYIKIFLSNEELERIKEMLGEN